MVDCILAFRVYGFTVILDIFMNCYKVARSIPEWTATMARCFETMSRLLVLKVTS